MAVFFKICFINVEDSIIGDDRKKTQFTLYFTIAIDNHIGLVFWCRTYSVGRTKKMYVRHQYFSETAPHI